MTWRSWNAYLISFKCWSRGGGGGQGVRTPPPGKSQVIWVYIGNKQLDPPGKSWTPPGKCWAPSGTLKTDIFLWNWPFDFCKISWGLKETSELFLSDWPGPSLTKIPGFAHVLYNVKIGQGQLRLIIESCFTIDTGVAAILWSDLNNRRNTPYEFLVQTVKWFFP